MSGATRWSGVTPSSGATQSCGGTSTTPDDWRHGLPALAGELLTLRELRQSDAESLFIELTSPEVRRFTWAPPTNAGAFAKFIEWTHAERQTGKYICYGIVPKGEEHAVGVYELRQLQPGFLRGELGFVMAARLWGKGFFIDGARLVLDFAFRTVKVHRIEARAAVDNARGNAALQKMGARREGRLRDAFWREDRYVDQYLWAILDSDWREQAAQLRDK
ncbi:MAG TPA: GNAT family protein [Vicinamibacterales bacterium]|nr:GNAT family protein [Vicinamibacterales bacterium]